MTVLASVRRRALASLIPPPCLQLSQWIKREIMLPEGTSALPGRVCLWLYQRDIADAISYPEIERGTLVKPVCVGFTTLLTGAIGSYVANEPAPRKFGGSGSIFPHIRHAEGVRITRQ